jgi:hypothetical protein
VEIYFAISPATAVSNLGRVETTPGGGTHRAIFVVRSRATLKSRKYLFGKSVRISDFLRRDFRAWLFIWRKSAYVGYWRATLRQAPGVDRPPSTICFAKPSLLPATQGQRKGTRIATSRSSCKWPRASCNYLRPNDCQIRESLL